MPLDHIRELSRVNLSCSHEGIVVVQLLQLPLSHRRVGKGIRICKRGSWNTPRQAITRYVSRHLKIELLRLTRDIQR